MKPKDDTNLKVQLTRDGSSTLLHQELDETYHSRNGAWVEAQHVFIKEGLDYFKNLCLNNGQELSSLSVFEMGFGTGLNAWCTMIWAIENKVKVHFQTIEKFPVSLEIINQLNYKSFVESEEYQILFDLLHRVDWNETNELQAFFKLEKIESDLFEWRNKERNKYPFDIVMFDAFAPNKQEELWTEPALMEIQKEMKTGGVLTTYCAQGKFRRMLKEIGFEVERIQGPPGKHHMTRATKK